MINESDKDRDERIEELKNNKLDDVSELEISAVFDNIKATRGGGGAYAHDGSKKRRLKLQMQWGELKRQRCGTKDEILKAICDMSDANLFGNALSELSITETHDKLQILIDMGHLTGQTAMELCDENVFSHLPKGCKDGAKIWAVHNGIDPLYHLAKKITDHFRYVNLLLAN